MDQNIRESAQGASKGPAGHGGEGLDLAPAPLTAD